MAELKEREIRDRTRHNRYLELVRVEAEQLAKDPRAFIYTACPACGGKVGRLAFEKTGFRYVECSSCETLYANPRPTFAALTSLYTDSPSTRYWVEEFFKPMAEARREKIFKPRAEFIAQCFPQLSRARIGDIGAGFGLFLKELRAMWPHADIVAIEPSAAMAELLRAEKLAVVEEMLENVPERLAGFDLLTAFELFEHLHDPLTFLRSARDRLKPGGHLYLTTLNGQGFDILLHWERSKAVSPPHHLNFLNPRSMETLLKRAGFDAIRVDTPGQLDWDIVEGASADDGIDPGRLFRAVASHADDAAKRKLQAWIRDSRFSSHLRAVARRPL